MSVRRVSLRGLVRGVPSTTYATHGLYLYPARFIPHIVRYVLERYTRPGDWVFDPFAGSGVLAVEASLTGRSCVLWDLNPMLRLLVEASTHAEPLTLGDFYVDFNYPEPFHPRWANIAYWHPRGFYEAISRAWGYWRDSVDRRLKPLVAIPLLKVTRYFSYSDERVAKLYRSKRAEEKVRRLLNTNWRGLMERVYWGYARRVLEKVRDYQKRGPMRVEVVVEASDERVFTGKHVIVDSTERKLGGEVDAMVTSPPYLQAQEYIRSFKLELAWLGFTESFIASLTKHEIPYNRVGEGHVSSGTYEKLKREVEKLKHERLLELYVSYFNSTAKLLNNNHDKIAGVIALTVGPAKIRGTRIPVDTILKEHLEHLGWRHEETLVDTIASRRLFKTSVNPSTNLPEERIPEERILVMKRAT